MTWNARTFFIPSFFSKGLNYYVNRKNVRIVRSQVKNYTRLRKLVEKWLELGSELSDLRLSDKVD
ncbi:MAG TPA: hypothetical protein ENH52_16155 [Nitrospirae bacterium]|nr:hypothetical protein [Nitrospirota bacterium]